MNWKLLALALPLSAALAACAADTEETAPQEEDPTEATEADLTKLSYATVGPIVTANCGGCHAPFKTLAGIKANKTAMLSMLKAGAMPKGNPGFKSTADGKKVLSWLKSGKDLK